MNYMYFKAMNFWNNPMMNGNEVIVITDDKSMLTKSQQNDMLMK